MVLADTNLIIYAASTNYPKVRAWVAATTPSVSATTRVEELGYHRLTATDEAALLAVFARLAVLPISDPVVDEAIRLRRQRNMDLGDALIAGTALVYGFDLATRNLADFTWIPGLHVFDPS